MPGEPLLRGRIGGAYVTPPGYRYGLYLRQRLGQSRIFTPDENKVTVKETVSQVSARSILLCDSSKYNQVATFMALPLTRFTTIITDRHLSDAAASHIARHACEVLRAG